MSRMENLLRGRPNLVWPTAMTIEEIYDEAIKPLPTSERFRLATLILNEIPPQSVVDIGDAWNEQDMKDIAAYSAAVRDGIPGGRRPC